MVYSIPAQPPFLMPTRMPLASDPEFSTIALTRAAAPSVMLMIAKPIGSFSFRNRGQDPVHRDSNVVVQGKRINTDPLSTSRRRPAPLRTYDPASTADRR